MAEQEIEWRQPEEGFQFAAAEVTVSAEHQEEKLAACGLDHSLYAGCVDPAFYIGLGIRAGIRNGISAEGNVNMLQTLIQHRPVLLGEVLTVHGAITKITQVPRGLTVDTEVWFDGADGKTAISAPRRSLKPDPTRGSKRGAGDRPAAVIEDLSSCDICASYALTPGSVKRYSSEGNSIHYEMDAAIKAGFRAPIIGGGMGVHYMIHALWERCQPRSFDLSIYFRRPIFWDDEFAVVTVPGTEHDRAVGLIRDDKVLTEARINKLE